MADDGATGIAAQLGRAAVELGHARDRTLRTHTAATDAQHYIARYGFLGIARGIEGIKTQVTVVQSAVDAAISATTDAAGSAASIPDDGTPDEVLALLDALLAAVGIAAGATRTANDEAATAQAVVSSALVGGTPGPLLGRLQNVRAALDSAATALDTARTGITMASARARTAGALGANAVASAIDVPAPENRREALGSETEEPGERLGAKIHSAPNGRSRLRRAQDGIAKEGDGLAKDATEMAQHFQSALQHKDPDMCIPMSGTRPEASVPQQQRPDRQQAAATVLDTLVFIFDIVFIGARRARSYARRKRSSTPDS